MDVQVDERGAHGTAIVSTREDTIRSSSGAATATLAVDHGKVTERPYGVTVSP
jgi:hypothetical protein